MPYNKYLQISKEKYDIISERFQKFSKTVDDTNTKPVAVFDQLNEKQMEELLMIRELSKNLQIKRDEEVKRVEQQAAEAEKQAKEIAEQAKAAAAATSVEAAPVEAAPVEKTPVEA